MSCISYQQYALIKKLAQVKALWQYLRDVSD